MPLLHLPGLKFVTDLSRPKYLKNIKSIFLTMSGTNHEDRTQLQSGHLNTLDPATGLRHWRANYGRPRWDRIFEQIKTDSSNSKHIGVFTCGPKPLTRELKSLCNSHSKSGIKFKFHKENF